LLEILPKKPLPEKYKVTWNPYGEEHIANVSHLTQDFLWAVSFSFPLLQLLTDTKAMGRFFKDGDLVIAETGTSAFGIPASSLQRVEHMHLYNQTIYGSIGFATGSAVGAFVASKELNLYKRHILITGEGSLQLTVQAFADLIRHEVNPIIFLLNNDGYTIERLIHGMDAEYNTLPVWDYAGLFQAFAPKHKTRHLLIKTPQELEAILDEPDFINVTTPTASHPNVDRPMLILLDCRDDPG
jgi:pyruvate decarboxylase